MKGEMDTLFSASDEEWQLLEHLNEHTQDNLRDVDRNDIDL